MFVKSLKLFSSSVFGNVSEGQVLEMNERRAEQLIGAGLVVACATTDTHQKVAEQVDFHQSEAGNTSSSQAETVSTSKTASLSGVGKPRVYRKPKRKS